MQPVGERSWRRSANLPLTITRGIEAGKSKGGRIVRNRLYYIILCIIVRSVVGVSKLDGALFMKTVGRHALVRRRAHVRPFPSFSRPVLLFETSANRCRPRTRCHRLLINVAIICGCRSEHQCIYVGGLAQIVFCLSYIIIMRIAYAIGQEQTRRKQSNTNIFGQINSINLKIDKIMV